MLVLAVTVALSLFAIGGLHIFWGCGGQWGVRATLPKKTDGSLLFRPGIAACFVVAAGLCGMAWLVLAQRRIVAGPLSEAWSVKLHWVFAAIFALRCLGDFQYVGLFRRVQGTDFATMDAKLFTPLCALYAAAFAMLALNS